MTAAHVPARPDETAVGFALMRALLCHLLLERSRRTGKPAEFVYTAKQEARWSKEGPPVMLRIVMDKDYAIRAWLEEPEPGMRRGVAYVAPDAPLEPPKP